GRRRHCRRSASYRDARSVAATHVWTIGASAERRPYQRRPRVGHVPAGREGIVRSGSGFGGLVLTVRIRRPADGIRCQGNAGGLPALSRPGRRLRGVRRPTGRRRTGDLASKAPGADKGPSVVRAPCLRAGSDRARTRLTGVQIPRGRHHHLPAGFQPGVRHLAARRPGARSDAHADRPRRAVDASQHAASQHAASRGALRYTAAWYEAAFAYRTSAHRASAFGARAVRPFALCAATLCTTSSRPATGRERVGGVHRTVIPYYVCVFRDEPGIQFLTGVAQYLALPDSTTLRR